MSYRVQKRISSELPQSVKNIEYFFFYLELHLFNITQKNWELLIDMNK